MQVQEINKNEWKLFIDDFFKRHKNWLFSIEVNNTTIGKEAVAQNLKLEKMAIKFNGSGNESIVVGKNHEEELEEFINNIAKMEFEKEETDNDEIIYLHSEEGTVTTLSFRSSGPPNISDYRAQSAF